MGVLSDREILTQIEFGHIKITPFDRKQLNPNSYDLRLHPQLKVYQKGHWLHKAQGEANTLLKLMEFPLDMRVLEPTVDLVIPEDGLVLYPGVLYLGQTVEHTETLHHVPCITGRSSVARLGLSVHTEAGFGDNGFKGTFTLEITVVHPLRVYPNVRVGQIYYLSTEKGGGVYKGKYQNQEGPRPSELWRDFAAYKPV